MYKYINERLYPTKELQGAFKPGTHYIYNKWNVSSFNHLQNACYKLCGQQMYNSIVLNVWQSSGQFMYKEYKYKSMLEVVVAVTLEVGIAVVLVAATKKK